MVLTSDLSKIRQFSQQFIDEQEAAKKQLSSQKIEYAELERILLSDDSEQEFINPEKAPSFQNTARQQGKCHFESSNSFFQLGKRKYMGTEQESPPQKKQATKQNTGWQPVPETNKNLFDFSDAKFTPVYTPW